ncbi:hypothetical protein ACHAWF_012485 [Thalassiosira exigua]
MNLAIRIAAAILSVPPDVLAPMVPMSMLVPPPKNSLEYDLRNEVDSVLSGTCCSSADGAAPLFAISREETNFVNCNTGLPSDAEALFESIPGDENASPKSSTYGEITVLGARQLFHHMGLANDKSNKLDDQFFDLGSGGGRLVVQSHLELPSVAKSVGIELSPSRHKVAARNWQRLVQNGDAERIRKLAEESWGVRNENSIKSTVELHEGDLFELDITKATHLYVSSLCFSENMLERLVDKIERDGISLKIVASLRLLPSSRDEVGLTQMKLGTNPWMEFVEMSWTKGRGEGCPVYFYSVVNDA